VGVRVLIFGNFLICRGRRNYHCVRWHAVVRYGAPEWYRKIKMLITMSFETKGWGVRADTYIHDRVPLAECLIYRATATPSTRHRLEVSILACATNSLISPQLFWVTSSLKIPLIRAKALISVGVCCNLPKIRTLNFSLKNCYCDYPLIDEATFSTSCCYFVQPLRCFLMTCFSSAGMSVLSQSSLLYPAGRFRISEAAFTRWPLIFDYFGSLFPLLGSWAPDLGIFNRLQALTL